MDYIVEDVGLDGDVDGFRLGVCAVCRGVGEGESKSLVGGPFAIIEAFYFQRIGALRFRM